MAVLISLLRAVNLGGHNKIKMDALRALYESLGLRDAQTYIQSGNVIFRADRKDAPALSRQIENAIERKFGFRSAVMLRSAPDLRNVIAGNPFASRRGLDPRKLAVIFLAGVPLADAQTRLVKIEAGPEELRIAGRELYIYFANGMARPKLSPALIEKTLGMAGTARNWNTVGKLVEIAEAMEAAE